MPRVYLMPVNTLNVEALRQMFKKAKADARGSNEKVQQVPKDETPK
jgi:hypothetical protein